MPLADYYDMVKAVPPQRANHPLRVGVLPWRAWRNDRLPDVQQPRLTRKSFAIDLIPVPDQMPRALVLPARLDQLSCRPFRRRVLGDIEMHQPAPALAQHDQHKEHLRGRRRHREENPTRSDLGHGSSERRAMPATAAAEAGACTAKPSPAKPSGPASTARRGSSVHPRADSRGSSAESDPAVPSQSRADPIGVDSSMPSTA